MQLNFRVNRDKLTPLFDSRVYTGNQLYYQAAIEFETDDWDGIAKTVVFVGSNTYNVVLAGTDTVCNVPSEVLTDEGEIWVGVYGVDGDGLRMSTNLVPLNVDTGAFRDGTAPVEPTAEVWEQYEAAMDAATAAAQGYSASAATSATSAARSATSASESATAAGQSAENAQSSKQRAQVAADNAEGFADTAEGFAENAETSAGHAEASAQQANGEAERAKGYADSIQDVLPNYYTKTEADAITDTKIPKVSSATENDIATLKSDGTVKDSGKKIGGSTLAGTPDADTLATEAAVKTYADGKALRGLKDSTGNGGLRGVFADQETQNYQLGAAAVALGMQTGAPGDSAFSTGYEAYAEGVGSVAEGRGTTASGNYSHAEGISTTASGNYSHAEGNGTIAASENQHVQGKYNIEDNLNAFAHIVGGGSDNNPDNIYTLDWSGNGWFAGEVRVGSDNKALATEDYADVTITQTSDNDYAAVYTISQAGATLGTINIPKDMVISNAELKTVTTADVPYQGAVVGDKYIDITIANAQSNHIYLPVKDLVDVYTAQQNATQIQLAIDANNVISASIVAGSVGTTELANGAVTANKIAVGAVSTVRLASKAVTAGKIFDNTITTGQLAAGVNASLNKADVSVRYKGKKTVSQIGSLTGKEIGDMYKVADTGTIPAVVLSATDLTVQSNDVAIGGEDVYIYKFTGTNALSAEENIPESALIEITDGTYTAKTDAERITGYQQAYRIWNKISGDAGFSFNSHGVTYDVTSITMPSISVNAGDCIVWTSYGWMKYTGDYQPKVTASGLLKGNGSGTISSAVAGTDYQAPLTAGTDYATPLSVINAASIDASGLISFKHGSTSIFTLQLPVYNGGVS